MKSPLKDCAFWMPVLLGALATPVCLVLGAVFSIGGHSLTAMSVFFPFGMLLAQISPEIHESIALLIFGLQYPLYGLAAALALRDDRFRWLVIGLLIAHLLLVLWHIAFNFYTPEEFTTPFVGFIY
jgi:hypothetical protein